MELVGAGCRGRKGGVGGGLGSICGSRGRKGTITKGSAVEGEGRGTVWWRAGYPTARLVAGGFGGGVGGGAGGISGAIAGARAACVMRGGRHTWDGGGTMMLWTPSLFP
jgi:hypothetical protein